jgi:hypothetical protein
MSNVEKQLARAEAIIDALITENRLLKARIAQLEKADGTKTDFVSQVRNEDGTKTHFSSTVKSDDGIETDFSSIVKSYGGTDTRFLSYLKSEDGIETRFSSTAKSDDGTETDFSSIVKSEDGIETRSAHYAKSEGGTETPFHALPKTIDPTLCLEVANQLSAAGITRVTGSFLVNVARLMIHFYNGSPSDYGTLQKLTSLSRGGLAKNMMSMRKRGIIVNAGFQRYEISAWSKEILKKSVMKKNLGS